MIAEELINHMIPPLKMSDKAHKAILWMEELRTNQLPVIEEGKFKGFISEEVIFEGNNIEKSISDFRLFAENCFVDQNQHFYDIVKAASDDKVQMVAVLDEFTTFMGVITISDIMIAFAQTAAVQSPGGIIVISMNQIDYSMTEIARLIESNNARILSSCISNDLKDPGKIKLTLKINRVDMTHINATLERFGYKIIALFQEHLANNSNEKERLDILLKYLNI